MLEARTTEGTTAFNDALTFNLVLASCVQKQRALQVKKQPDDVFFKDEGGKSNVLSAVITLPQAVLRSVGPLQLKCELHYESNRRVEEADQSILNLSAHEYEPLLLTPQKPDVEVEFRLEKVSRRKDNQRFRLHVDVDYEAMGVTPTKAQLVAGVSTSPITVLSKRKTGERQVSKRVPRPECGSIEHAREAATHSRDAANGIKTLTARVAGLERSVRASHDLARRQAETICRLESMLEAVLGGRAGIPTPPAPMEPPRRQASLALSDHGGSDLDTLTSADVDSALERVKTPHGGSERGSSNGSIATAGTRGRGAAGDNGMGLRRSSRSRSRTRGGAGEGAADKAAGPADDGTVPAAPSDAFVLPSPSRESSMALIAGLRGLSATLNGLLDGPPAAMRDLSSASARELETVAARMGFPPVMRREDSAAFVAALLGGVSAPTNGRFPSMSAPPGPPGDAESGSAGAGAGGGGGAPAGDTVAHKRLRSGDMVWDYGVPAPAPTVPVVPVDDAPSSVPAKRTRRSTRR